MGRPRLAPDKKRAARRQAHVVFLDESGFSLYPIVRRTWGLKGQTPVMGQVGRHRQKVSSISAITVSPCRRRLQLLIRFLPDRSVEALDVERFLRHLLRHREGFVIVLWDRGSQHKAGRINDFLRRHRRRIAVEFFPAYAPELNPDEHVWTNLKYHRLANHGFPNLPILHRRLHYHSRRLRADQEALWACIEASELPLRRP